MKWLYVGQEAAKGQPCFKPRSIFILLPNAPFSMKEACESSYNVLIIWMKRGLKLNFANILYKSSLSTLSYAFSRSRVIMAPGACSLEFKNVFRIETRLWTMFLPGRAPSWLGPIIRLNTFLFGSLLFWPLFCSPRRVKL